MSKLWITYFLDLWRFLRSACSLAILSLTISLGTATSLRASALNLPHPLGFIKTPLLFSHESSVLNTSENTIRQTLIKNQTQQKFKTNTISPLSCIEPKNLF